MHVGGGGRRKGIPWHIEKEIALKQPRQEEVVVTLPTYQWW
jgi:hypothetical protein